MGKLDKQISKVENEAKCLIPSVVRKLENLEKTVDQDSSTNEDFRKVRNDIGFKNLIVQISITFLITHISYMTNTECIKSEVTTRIQNKQKKYL